MGCMAGKSRKSQLRGDKALPALIWPDPGEAHRSRPDQALASCPHLLSSITELPPWWGRRGGREEAVDNQAGCWGEKTTQLSCEPGTLEIEPSGCITELLVHPCTCLSEWPHWLWSGLIPCTQLLASTARLPFSMLHPAEADPSVEFVSQALKTKLLGG